MVRIARSWPSGALELPRFQAHRGFWRGGCAENSLAAFAAAQDRGAQMVECDVRLSADHDAVLAHDPDLKRIAGVELMVSGCSTRELAKWGVATLAEALAAFPQLKFNIEIKADSSIFASSLLRAVARVVAPHHHRVLISSFHPWVVLQSLYLMPEIPSAQLVSSRLQQLGACPLVRPQLIHLPESRVNQALVTWLARLGFSVAVWTVNDRAHAELYLQWGVASVISDDLISV